MPKTLHDLLTSQFTDTRSIHLHRGDNECESLSYREMHTQGCQVHEILHSRGAQVNDYLLIFSNDNPALLRAFWGGILGGIIPVPLAVGIADEHRLKLLRIAKKLGNPWLYTDRRSFDRLGDFAARVGETETFEKLRARCLIAETLELGKTREPVAVTPEHIAFIQFSSGSTSEPKGIMLSHANILANMHQVTERTKFNSSDVSLSWMPLTHDMGLIGKHLYMIANGIENHIFPTDLFIRRPLLWMQIASKVKASILSSPNFGYRHFLKVLGQRQLEGLDLSAVRLIFNGAEPISPPLCDEFMQAMAGYGLKKQAMYPVYGLAEATLAVSFPPLAQDYHTTWFDRMTLNQGQAAQTTSQQSPHALPLMAVGQVLNGIELRLVDQQTQSVPPGCVGEIQVRGDNVTRGYHELPEATQAALSADGWLSSGDLGLIYQNNLYITGRAKEIIFINGQNYYPYDLEHLVEKLPNLELGKVVAVGARPDRAEEDELTIFILHRGSMPDFVPLVHQTKQVINEKLGLEVKHVVPVKRIPKTTSGKIQRVALEKAFVNGEFNEDINNLRPLLAQTTLTAQATVSEQTTNLTAATGTHGSLEDRLLGICRDAMSGKTLSAQDNLFEIGASSLTLIQIHERIDSEFPGLVDLTELFDYPTIASLAEHLRSKQPNMS